MSYFYAYQPLLDLLLINAGFALSQYIVLRAGVFSIATPGIVAIGAYLAAILMVRHDISIWGAAPAGLVAGLVVGYVLSIPLARLRGPYQAIATLAFVQFVIALALYAEPVTGGAVGISDIPKQVSTVGLVGCVAATIYVLSSIHKTRLGRIFDALRQDEAVAASLGISVEFHHALAFGLSGAIAGLFGALQAGYVYAIEPQQYGFAMLTTTLAAVILGGRRSVWGPIAGAALMTALPELGRPLADNKLLMNGLLLTLMIIFLPRGLVDSVLWMRDRRRNSASLGPASSKIERPVQP